jgi:hypothetical protein
MAEPNAHREEPKAQRGAITNGVTFLFVFQWREAAGSGGKRWDFGGSNLSKSHEI